MQINKLKNFKYDKSNPEEFSFIYFIPTIAFKRELNGKWIEIKFLWWLLEIIIIKNEFDYFYDEFYADK